jgi:transposase
MDYFAGLDVSVKDTSICIVDDTGKITREVRVASEPDALLAVLRNPTYRFKRIGLEAGPLSQWLFSALAEADLPVICVETRHMRAVLKAQINKTDRNDARGIAQMIRVGLYRPVHVKTLRSQKLRMLLTHRKLLQSKAIAVDNDLRATLRNFGLKVGMVGTTKFEARIKELVENLPDLILLVEPLLVVRRVLREQIGVLHRRLLAVVRDDEVCRRLMTVPGVGPVVALTYRASIDVPARFRRSKSVGARRHLAVRGRDDADDALRSSPEHAGAFNKMVLAQGLGDENRPASWHEKSHRRAGTPVGGDHASYLG